MKNYRIDWPRLITLAAFALAIVLGTVAAAYFPMDWQRLLSAAMTAWLGVSLGVILMERTQ